MSQTRRCDGAERASDGNGTRRRAAGRRQTATGRCPRARHGLDPELVKHDQRERLQKAMIELIAEKGYPAVRIVDLAKLAHVSQPTFYSLFADKEDLFLSAYDEVADAAAEAVVEAYDVGGSHERAPGRGDARVGRARGRRARGDVAARARRLRRGLEALERRRHVARRARAAASTRAATAAASGDSTDLTVKAILGGIREVTATRLREGRASELPELADELTAWATCYPRRLPAGLAAPPTTPREAGERAPRRSLRARTARRGPAAERAQRPAAPVHRQKPARADRRRDRGDRRRERARGADDPRDRAPRQRLAPDLLRHLRLQARRVPGRAEGRHAPGADGSPSRPIRPSRTTGRGQRARGSGRCSTTSPPSPPTRI